MTLEDVLQELLQCLSIEGDSTLSWEQVREWPKGAMEGFQRAGWLKAAPPAATVECPGCEESCFTAVHVVPAQNGQTARAYVACDYRDDIGRVKIPLTHLEQWQITEGQIARWASKALGLKSKPIKDKASGTFKLGNIQGKDRLGPLELTADESVYLKVSGHSLPLSEVITFEDGQPTIDQATIIALVDRPPTKETPDRSQSSTIKLEARKLDTAARYKSWCKEARRIRKNTPGKSERWVAQRIAKMPIASGASWETIRKNIRQ